MSGEESDFDTQRAHRHFAVECFNHAWTYIDKPSRTPEDEEAMVLAAMTSFWHWTHRADCTNRNLSIGHWQLSRVMALIGRGDDAMHHALQSISFAEGLQPFYVGYAHEAAARAALILNNRREFAEQLAEAKSYAAAVLDAEERGALEQDLESIEASVNWAA